MDHKQVIEELLRRAEVQIGGSGPGDVQVHDERVYRRILAEGSLGLGESFIDGWWDAPRLDEFFYRIHSAELVRDLRDRKLALNAARARLFNMQNKRLSARVAEQHYDLSNQFYERMLGPHMQYTCAYWKR